MSDKPTESVDDLIDGKGGVDLVVMRLRIPTSSQDFDDFNDVVRTITPVITAYSDEIPMWVRVSLLRTAIGIMEDVLSDMEREQLNFSAEDLGVEGEDWGKSDGIEFRSPT